MRSTKITRIVAVASAAALGMLGLAACGGGDGDTGGATGGNGASATIPADGVDDGTKITMWTRAPLERQAKALVEAYNSSHKNQVALEIIPNDDMEGKVGGAAQNGELPDLLAGDVVRLPYWVDQGMFTDITSQIEALPNRADLADGHIKAGTNKDGKAHALPFVIDISVMAWNKALYKEAGLDPEKGPGTIAEFVEQAKAVANLKKDGVSGTFYGGNCGGCGVFTMFPFIWASGDDVLNEDGSAATLTSDSAKAMFQAFYDLNKSGAVGAGSKDETGATWTAAFSEGKIGVMMYPNTAVYAAKEAGIDVGVKGIPGVNGDEATFTGGDAMGISKDSKNVDQAWNFLSWMMSKDTQLNVVAKNGEVPSDLTLLDNEYSQKDPLALTMNKLVAKGRTPAAVYFAEAFNASGSPWVNMIRAETFDNAQKYDEENQAITDILAQ